MFIDPKKFDIVAELESGWRAIRDEYLNLPKNSFEPWVQRDMYGDGWSVYGFYAFGKIIEEALQKCPETAKCLAKIPNLTTAGFSKLAPQTHIAPHVGWVTTVYRLHLGLIVPDQCALRVGEETRAWREGECLIFDDTVEHEAWNRSNLERVILLLDFTRPGMEARRQDALPKEVEKFVQNRLK